MRYRVQRLAAGVILLLVASLSLTPAKSAPLKNGTTLPFRQIQTKELPFAPGEVIVKFRQNRFNGLRPLSSEQNFPIKEWINDGNLAVLQVRKGQSVEQAASELAADPSVEYAEPNYILHIASLPNDSSFGKLWGLNNTGQSVNGSTGAVDSDIDAPEAWALETDAGQTAIVAVIDTGVAYNHPDLSANMWNGSAGCKDENNGVISGGCPNHGWDFFNNDNTPLDDNGHGTHLAGTIAAVADNNTGIAGLSKRNKIKIMALKAFDNQGAGPVSDVAKAISFAKNNGVKIINASFAGPGNSQTLRDVVAAFPGLVIAAAGNSGANNEVAPEYPASYTLENIISVAATDQSDNLAGFSNYGVTAVDVGAPGTNIYSATYSQVTTNLLFETFESVASSSLPSGWTQDGAWGVVDKTAVWGSAWGKVLAGDWHRPYAANGNTAVTSPAYPLTGAAQASFEFWTRCDTSYHLNSEGTIFQDFMALEFSADGADYSQIQRWNELSLDIENGEPENSAGWATKFYNLSIPVDYLTENFKFRFRWATDAVDNDYDGCVVDDLLISKTYVNSNSYRYLQGTSMAAPHAAGLAGLLWSAKSDLTSAEVKAAILNTGDPVSSLAGKTVTGKRINAFNALKSVLPPASHSISGTIKYYDGLKKVSDANVVLEDREGNQLASVISDGNGNYQFNDVVGGGNYIIKVQKQDSGASGVSGSDLVKIRRHIVELEKFESVYKIASADFNETGSVSGSDLVKIRRYVVELDHPSVTWKFYNSDFILSADNYLSEGSIRKYDNLNADLENQDFIGVKMGDVNNSWNSI